MRDTDGEEDKRRIKRVITHVPMEINFEMKIKKIVVHVSILLFYMFVNIHLLNTGID